MRVLGSAENRLTTVAVLATLLIACLDMWTGGSAVLIGLLIVGPLLASASLTARRTAVVGVFALALSALLGFTEGIFGTTDHLLRCLVVATGAAFSAFVAQRRTERERALIRVTRIAEVAQRTILRPIPARLGGVSFAVRYLSAAEEAVIGGDFYDALLTPHGLRVLVGDVKGKGLEAVRVAAVVLGAFRECAFSSPDLRGLAAELDASTSRHLGDEDFVTAVLVEFGPAGELRLVNCGHPPPLRFRGGVAEPLARAEPTTPLGLGPDPAVQCFRLGPGDRVLLYTDGLVEARDAGGRGFQVAERAAGALAVPSLGDALDGLVGLVLEHTGGNLDDDLALVLAQPRGRAGRQASAAQAGQHATPVPARRRPA
jgi:sigma-B regulation protein RsbU (phosphoserine phosphatase)